MMSMMTPEVLKLVDSSESHKSKYFENESFVFKYQIHPLHIERHNMVKKSKSFNKLRQICETL